MAGNNSCNTDNIITGAACLCVDGIDVGLTTDGISIRTERSFVETEADQLLGIAKRSLQIERMFVSTTLLEQSLENIRVVLGYPSTNFTSPTELCLGYNVSCGLPEHEIVVKGPGPGCGCRTYVFTRAVSISSPEITFQRDQETRMSVEFEVLKDCETGFFGCVTDGCDFADTITCE